jgi:hypothetical protein
MVETLLRIVTEAFVVSSAAELTTSTNVVRQLADAVAVVVERGLTNNFVRANFARSPHTHLTPPRGTVKRGIFLARAAPSQVTNSLQYTGCAIVSRGKAFSIDRARPLQAHERVVALINCVAIEQGADTKGATWCRIYSS